MGGFLNKNCTKGNKTKFKCHNTEEMYEFGLFGYEVKGQLCSNDPYFYQACQNAMEDDITNNELFCGKYFCSRYDNLTLVNETVLAVAGSGRHCNGSFDCLNTKIDETLCPDTADMTALPSGTKVPVWEVCNDKCYDKECEDEAICNGYTYGMYCKGKDGDEYPKYVPPNNICDREPQCLHGEDENNCTVTEGTLYNCTHYSVHDNFPKSFHKSSLKFPGPPPPDPEDQSDEINVPIHNFTRCYIERTQIKGKEIFENRYCTPPIFHDQANCTDPNRIGLTCEYDGYMTSWSKLMVCPTRQSDGFFPVDVKSLCDNRIDEDCTTVSPDCHLHKHYLCDWERDCEDGSDENDPLCRKMTEITCRRHTKLRSELPLPLSWLQDGMIDCIDGKDEEGGWPTCGTGQSVRFVSHNRTCQNVYLCPNKNEKHVLLGELCDGIETCGNEVRVCEEGHSYSKLYTEVYSIDKSWNKYLSYCLKGLNYTNSFFPCTTIHSFIFPDHDYFGVDNRTTITLPTDPQTCDHMFGEMYVYTSCTNNCNNSTCPLRNFPRYEMCPSQYRNKIGTIAKTHDREYLAFFTKTLGNSYTNRYFVCENNITCIEYSKVCDLVDDCEDASDEKHCTNHFECRSTGRFIPKTKMCDKSFDCFDLSDECHEQCPHHRHFLQNRFVYGRSWVIGSFAVLANLFIISKSTLSLKNCRTTVALLNKLLIIVISFGDFLIGCYLLTISIYFGIIHRDSYCTKQISWITSTECSILGVISTLGSQISLFAMCVLSVIRVVGISNSMKVPGEVNGVKFLKILCLLVFMVLSAMSIALIPIFSGLEDFFVNGVKYSDELKVFIGTPNKRKVFVVLKQYYGRMKDTTLSWKLTNKMVRDMYSHDFDYPDHTTEIPRVHFYGNDGACLFKYFVDDQDPQRIFVWSILALNFLCFILITVSYIFIGFHSYKSSKTLTQSGGNQQISQRNRKMNRKITFIITTDFLCWVPFILTCVLHSMKTLDATRWYGLFSMFILPINSVINPLIYDETLSNIIITLIQRLSTNINNTRAYQRLRRRLASSTRLVVSEMEMK